MGNVIEKFFLSTGFSAFAWGNLVMLLISFALFYLGIRKKFEPLLLVPIAFGMFLANLPLSGIFSEPSGHAPGGLAWYFALGFSIWPPLIFMGIGAMTDFGALIANPKSLLLGAAAQLGVFLTFAGAILLGFNAQEASSIGIIGGASGPTAIYLTQLLAPGLLGPIAIAAYSYMALIPIIQPPIIRLLTTEKDRRIRMEQLRPVTRTEKIVFPLLVSLVVILLVPSVTPLIGMLMLGNVFRECLVTERLRETAANALMNILIIILGVTVGATASAQKFLNLRTLAILGLGVAAFAIGTAAGLVMARVLNIFSRNQINPLIGSAGVSAVPMAARVSQMEGQKADPNNFLLMHAMGPNVAGAIGAAVAAGVFLALFGLN